MRRLLLPLWFLAASCGPDAPAPSTAPASTTALSDRDWLIRASLAIRGSRPTPDEMLALDADPAQAEILVDAWLRTPAFLETVKNLHADLLLLRDDSVPPQYPSLGPLRDKNLWQIYAGNTNEPLDLIAAVVDADRPYSDIVTSKTTWIDEVGAEMWGLPYDFTAGPGIQETMWTDGRPLAGILSSGKLWQRYESAGSNFHRGRANVIADKLLCEGFSSRDIIVASGIDISDEAAVATAVRDLPACVACHGSLDPLAGFLWGFKNALRPGQVAHAYFGNCDDDYHDITLLDLGESYRTSHFCYPLQQYVAADADDWELWDLRAPSFYAEPAEDLADVGELIAEDPRFARCAVKNFVSYFTQITREEVPDELATRLQASFEESGLSARALVREIVLSPEFRASGLLPGADPDPTARMRTLRPEQVAGAIEELTGFSWIAAPDPADCVDGVVYFGNMCWGPIDLARTDRFGYHAMAGGTDSFWIVRPTYEPSPIQVLTTERFAWNAAGFVVDDDFARAPEDRRLLNGVEADTTDEAVIRAQLVALQLEILGEDALPDAPSTDALFGLLESARAVGDGTSAWKVLIAAMLQDPRMMFD